MPEASLGKESGAVNLGVLSCYVNLGNLISLRLSFTICKMGIICVFPS